MKSLSTAFPKSTSDVKDFLPLLPVFITLGLTVPVHAASLYWDGANSTADADSGDGTWDAGLTNWDPSLTAAGDYFMVGAGSAPSALTQSGRTIASISTTVFYFPVRERGCIPPTLNPASQVG